MSKEKEIADAQRSEAKTMLCRAIGLPEDTMSVAIDRAVDCIISAALLEATIVICNGMKEHSSNTIRISAPATPPNL